MLPLLLLSLTSFHQGKGVSVSVSLEEILTNQRQAGDIPTNQVAASTLSESKGLFSPQTYIKTFFGALGSGISSLIGLEGESEDRKTFSDKEKQHTGSNVLVTLPQCPVTSSKCRVRNKNRVEEELLTCGKAAQVGRVVNGSDVVPGEILFNQSDYFF